MRKITEEYKEKEYVENKRAPQKTWFDVQKKKEKKKGKKAKRNTK